MSRENDTAPDPPAPGEPDTEVSMDAAASAPRTDIQGAGEGPISEERREEIDKLLHQLAFRRPPVVYREGAESNGKDGARYFGEHAPAKRVTDLDTDPGANVIVRDSIREKTPPLTGASSAPMVTQPMLNAPPIPFRGNTDPMWPPKVDGTERVEMTPVPAPTWASTSARISREKAKATMRLSPEPRPKRLLFALVGAGFASLVIVIIYAFTAGGHTARDGVVPSAAPIILTTTAPGAQPTVSGVQSAVPSPPTSTVQLQPTPSTAPATPTTATSPSARPAGPTPVSAAPSSTQAKPQKPTAPSQPTGQGVPSAPSGFIQEM